WVGQDSKHKSDQQSIGWNVQIKIEDGVNAIRSHCAERADVQRQGIALNAPELSAPLGNEPTKRFAPAPEMCRKKQCEQQGPHGSKLRQKLQIVVMNVN